MRSDIRCFEIKNPKSLDDAFQILEKSATTSSFIAGGTDIMVLYEAGLLQKRSFINLWDIKELKGIYTDSDQIRIGSLCTFTEIRMHPVLQAEFPNLCQAAKETGSISIQNRGTLGGNIANASPAADSSPALLSYEAEVELKSKSGLRRIPYLDFHLSYKKTALRPDELVFSICLPRKKEPRFHFFRKVGTRKAQAISKICMSVVSEIKEGIPQTFHLGMGSVAPIPLKCHETESILTGKALTSSLIKQACQTLAQEIKPIGDIRSTSEYRSRVACNLLESCLIQMREKP